MSMSFTLFLFAVSFAGEGVEVTIPGHDSHAQGRAAGERLAQDADQWQRLEYDCRRGRGEPS